MTDINVTIGNPNINVELQTIVIDATVGADNINVTLTEKQEYVFNVVQESIIVEVGQGVSTGEGDMLKNTYDTNFNGLVDTCEYVDGGTF